MLVECFNELRQRAGSLDGHFQLDFPNCWLPNITCGLCKGVHGAVCQSHDRSCQRRLEGIQGTNRGIVSEWTQFHLRSNVPSKRLRYSQRLRELNRNCERLTFWQYRVSGIQSWLTRPRFPEPFCVEIQNLALVLR